MKPSERIWLQAGTEQWDITGDVTWNEEKINDSDIEYVRADQVAQLEGQPCSICGTQPALLVDAKEKATYWMCADCMFESIKDKMQLEVESERLSDALAGAQVFAIGLKAENYAALRLKTRHLIQSINTIRGTMVTDRSHKEVFGGMVYLVDHSHMWALVRNSEELDVLLTGERDERANRKNQKKN